ncbi:stage II sporulation protein R [Clostridium septicum]|uniref:Stage II sporulation protein R n=1 Tax=Clostridium septicum TaxID=1504 RepID=A0A9N7JMH9_CLOSE|nr:stage II sporulation protein R [Clostridium septicum]AYE34719.1 stage II sporulation protein R [Clostridium septicum]MDU1312772.1 stage II sporulation protein R [Clostridium septicum]QAS60120.1 stage II sporulation protein R [Clostridium septicum]UEC20634.1 stage II sporulation protein R [Clostridium septicum]USS01314.1 stage II sporulation protein R [Clostridium septicum]
MKKKFLVLISIIFVIGFFISCESQNSGQSIDGKVEVNYEDVADQIIRFHVIANSDSEEDQALKLKVRDKVVEYASSKLSDCENLDEARKEILNDKDEMERIAREVIEENGYDYNVISMLSRENFPDKMYGDLVFPQGEYEAYRILIGDASGQNWWCVMFPPLCFVDGTKDAIKTNDTEKKLEKLIDEAESNNEKEEPKVEFKFKFLESLKGLSNK